MGFFNFSKKDEKTAGKRTERGKGENGRWQGTHFQSDNR